MTLFPDIKELPTSITLVAESFRETVPGADNVSVADITLAFSDGAVTLTADKTPVKAAILRWERPLPENTRFCGDHWERGYGDFEWRGFVPHRVMPWYFYALAGKTFALYGVKVKPDALCAFFCDPAGITLHLDVSCGADGAVLSGRTITCAELVFAQRETDAPFTAAMALTPLLTQNAGAVFPKAPVYGFNNWYFAYGHSSAPEILDSARQLAALTQSLENRPFLVIDDCWQKERLSGFIGGSWRSSNEKFPDMGALAAEIASLGVKPGIWMRPVQNKAAEIPTAWYRDADAYLLDLSLDETLDYIAEDIRTIVGWGYKLIKHDYSTVDIAGDWGFKRSVSFVCDHVHFRNRTFTTAQIIKKLYQTIYTAADGKALILGCNVIGHLGVGFMELNRTGDDTSGLEWERTRKMGVNTLAFRMPQHRCFYDADADCVGITDAVPWDKNRQWLHLLANSGTPLFVSVAPDTLSPEQTEELHAALVTASKPHPPAVPLDWLQTCCPLKWQFGDKLKQYNWF